MMRLPAPPVFRVVTVLTASLALAGCGAERGKFAPACPIPGKLRPTDQLTRSRGGSPDARDLAIRARIVDVTGICKPGENDRTQVDVTVQVVADATRGPGLDSNSYDLPMFVAVTDATDVLDKRTFNVHLQFPPNVDTVRGFGPQVHMVLPITPTRSGAAYGIIGGFQLTPEEAAAGRR